MLEVTTNTKYPFWDLHEEDIPCGALFDFSLCVKEGVEPVLTNLVVGDYLFASWEDGQTGEPVCHVMEESPTTGSVYRLVMSAPGYGWVVMGQKLPVSVLNKRVPMNQRTVARLPSSTRSLTVNGVSYDMPRVLNVVFSGLLKASVGVSQNLVERNDSGVSEELLYTLLTDAEAPPRMITTVNGMRPDSSGNLVIQADASLGCPVVSVTKASPAVALRKTHAVVFGPSDESGCGDLKDWLVCGRSQGHRARLPLDLCAKCPDDDCVFDEVFGLDDMELVIASSSATGCEGYKAHR